MQKYYKEVPVLLDFEEVDKYKVIEKSGELLKESGFVEDRYIDSMKTIYDESGPYIVISKGIAMPHARPEDGALKCGFSIIRLKNGVEFGNQDNDPVKIVIGLSAKSNSDHLKTIQIISNILDGNEKVLLEGTEDEIRKIIKSAEEDV